MSGLRILHVAATSAPFVNGYTMRLHSIAAEQAARGFDVAVVTSPYYPGRAGQTDDARIDDVAYLRCVHPLECAAGGVRARLVRALRQLAQTGRPRLLRPAAVVLEERLLGRRFAQRIEAVARERRVDLIHVHTPYRCALPALAVGRRLGLPTIYEMRGLWEDTAVVEGTLRDGGPGYRYIRGREDRAFARADAVIALCESLADDLVRRGIPRQKIHIAPNGADLDRLATPPERARHDAAAVRARFADAGIVGYVGSVRPLEGVADLVRAVARLHARGRAIAGVVVGDGPALDDLRREAARLGIAERMVFTGKVPADDVGAWYDVIDVFAVTRQQSRVTDLVTPIKPLEAMGRGKAVVMSDLPALRELGEAAGAARYYRAGDVEHLAETLERLCAAPTERAELGERARAWVTGERTWARTVDAILGTYDALLAARRT
ncbi:MAG: glycosyltransferase family 4 protein [Planctomycetota bacterium]